MIEVKSNSIVIRGDRNLIFNQLSALTETMVENGFQPCEIRKAMDSGIKSALSQEREIMPELEPSDQKKQEPIYTDDQLLKMFKGMIQKYNECPPAACTSLGIIAGMYGGANDGNN